MKERLTDTLLAVLLGAVLVFVLTGGHGFGSTLLGGDGGLTLVWQIWNQAQGGDASGGAGTGPSLMALAVTLWPVFEHAGAGIIAVSVVSAGAALIFLAARTMGVTRGGALLAAVVVVATHTHSGPRTVSFLSHEIDPFIPPVDENYLQLIEDGIVAAAVKAHESSSPAKISISSLASVPNSYSPGNIMPSVFLVPSSNTTVRLVTLPSK